MPYKNKSAINRYGQPYSSEYLPERTRAIVLEQGFYDLRRGGIAGKTRERLLITGKIGKHGFCTLTSKLEPYQSVDIGHQMGAGKLIEFQMNGPIGVEWSGMHSPDFELFAEVING